jgi:hypothetical protein
VVVPPGSDHGPDFQDPDEMAFVVALRLILNGIPTPFVLSVTVNFGFKN